MGQGPVHVHWKNNRIRTNGKLGKRKIQNLKNLYFYYVLDHFLEDLKKKSNKESLGSKLEKGFILPLGMRPYLAPGPKLNQNGH